MHLYGGAVGSMYVYDECGGAEFVLLPIVSDKSVDNFVVADMVIANVGAYDTVVELKI